ncbi:hypothetical protein DYQ86_21730 [Acidobacteria bacterium AB60]|nr:hypothetical protein DYQ86_21730 [Acidobacteria bacterium AB60]
MDRRETIVCGMRGGGGGGGEEKAGDPFGSPAKSHYRRCFALLMNMAWKLRRVLEAAGFGATGLGAAIA